MNLSTKKITQCFAETRKNDAEPNGDDSSNWNVPLNYDVLRIIFKQLNARDISSSMLVCRNWKTAAIDEYSTRGPYCTLGNVKYPSGTLKEVSPQVNYQDLPIKPHFGFFFVASCSKLKVLTFKCPQFCPIIVLCNREIFQNKDEKNLFTSSKALFTLFPRIPNVQFHIVTLTEKVKFGKLLVNTLCQLPKVNASTTSTCCILLHSFKAERKIDFALDLLKLWKHKISSVWGGQMQHMSYVKNYQWKDVDGIVLFISGTIKTWSIIIDINWTTEELIKEKFMSFKEQVKLRRHSVAFLISSIRDQNELHDKITIQVRIFRNLFPKIPLVGFTGENVFTKDLIEERILRRQNIHTLNSDTENMSFSTFGTTLMILTYG